MSQHTAEDLTYIRCPKDGREGGREGGRKYPGEVCGPSLRTFASLCRETTLVLYIMTVVGMAGYTGTLNLGHLWIVYITAGIIG